MKMIKVTSAMLVMVMLFSACNSSKCYMKKFKRKAGKEVGRSNVSRRGDTVKVVYPEVAIFDFGKDEVKPDAKQTIRRFSVLLNKFDRVNFVINGYTDNVGAADMNVSLSMRRADNAKDVFKSNGVAAGRMRTNGMGERKPVMSNSTDEGRQANRRVEFLMYDKKSEKK